VKRALSIVTCVLSIISCTAAQAQPACRVRCPPEFKIEPMITFTNVYSAPGVVIRTALLVTLVLALGRWRSSSI
jgi:hypothetical protein